MADMKAKQALRKALLTELTVSVEEAGEALGIGRSSAYGAVRSKQLPHIRIGGRIGVPTAAIRKLLGIEEGKAA